eukprot:TRINITY_DN154_c0_g2_i2.p1 TRINITY_DN154_c0_g2~~TRINITY_DN154_c0_g2_i2.p1  ORF type:complete len:500 (+),score=75.98 TRINITY_DN154_c0_g2_i2:43-1542(+)
MSSIDLVLTIHNLQTNYQNRTLSPQAVIEKCYPSLQSLKQSFIHLADLSTLISRCEELEKQPSEQRGPLWGIPFAVKDNIDVGGMPTTAACPAYEYTPERSAPNVVALLEAGGICVGKTNMDQFAAGLVGTRSPYGEVPNAVDDRFVSGGSSSGSGVVVGKRLVSFALGTDTAGSGRVPAGLNGCVGVKPTVGYTSTQGVVPACRSLDCVTVFSQNIDDGVKVVTIMREYCAKRLADSTVRIQPHIPTNSLSIPGLKFAAPSVAKGTLQTSGPGGVIAEKASMECFDRGIQNVQGMGCSLVEDFDFQPFLEAARMLYGSSFVCERVSGIRDFLNASEDAWEKLLPVTKKILKLGDKFVGADVFDDLTKLEELKGKARVELSKVDFLVVPTVVHHYLIEEILEEEQATDPQWTQNANLGYYTNFVNLFDMAGIAIPAGNITLDYTTTQDEQTLKRKQRLTKNGGSAKVELPYGVTLVGPAWSDSLLWKLSSEFTNKWKYE